MLVKTNTQCVGYYRLGGNEYVSLEAETELELVHKTQFKTGEIWYFARFGKLRIWISDLNIIK